MGVTGIATGYALDKMHQAQPDFGHTVGSQARWRPLGGLESHLNDRIGARSGPAGYCAVDWRLRRRLAKSPGSNFSRLC